MGRIGSSERQRLLWIEGLGRKEGEEEILAGGCIWGSSRDKMGFTCSKGAEVCSSSCRLPHLHSHRRKLIPRDVSGSGEEQRSSPFLLFLSLGLETREGRGTEQLSPTVREEEEKWRDPGLGRVRRPRHPALIL